MAGRIIRFIFFGNYFIGILAIALSVEAIIQLRLPYNAPLYYLLVFCATVMYYTYAYAGASKSYAAENPRSAWYQKHAGFVLWSQRVLLVLVAGLSLLLIGDNVYGILHLPLFYWICVLLMLLSAISYYGLLPGSLIRFNLRNTGWIKAFVIGFVWACCVTLLPVIMLEISGDAHFNHPFFLFWFFVKNWMFCTVNAIMFDIKDYEDDANRQLKTFVVRFGLRPTIVYILVPLCLVGILSMLVFASYRHFSAYAVLINLIPFLLLLVIAWSMHHKHRILYYLIVIDGLLLVKALCGILAMRFIGDAHFTQ